MLLGSEIFIPIGQVFSDFFSSKAGPVLLGSSISIGTTLIFESIKDRKRRKVLRTALLEKLLSAQNYSVKIGTFVMEGWIRETKDENHLPIIGMQELFGAEANEILLSAEELVELFESRYSANTMKGDTPEFVSKVKDIVSGYNQLVSLMSRYNSTVLELEAFIHPYSKGRVGQAEHELVIPNDKLVSVNPALIKGDQYIHLIIERSIWLCDTQEAIEEEAIKRLRMKGRKKQFQLTESGQTLMQAFQTSKAMYRKLRS